MGQKKQKKRVGKPFGKPTLSSRGEMAIYLLTPRLYGIFNVAITAINLLNTRPRCQPFKSVREHHFSCVVPN